MDEMDQPSEEKVPVRRLNGRPARVAGRDRGEEVVVNERLDRWARSGEIVHPRMAP